MLVHDNIRLSETNMKREQYDPTMLELKSNVTQDTITQFPH